MTLLYSRLAFGLSNLLIPVSILIFAAGFFPHKPVLPGLAEYQHVGYENSVQAPFDRVIFMVVDALRSDFVFGDVSGFKFTQSLISSGDAVPFTAHASSPTVTMPRVKAITTGSIPSFLDLILNLAESDTTSTLANQDTWLAQLKQKPNGKIVFYGDDTWLKLFPGTFSRADGTSSFFVSDFTEVDNNVTRHVPDELKNDDWNAMVMHYLGLDHIGHKSGPRSVNMLPKQREMDSIVQTIYESMRTESHLNKALLVLCGDHGMNDGGNHGGSSPGETSPALVFVSPKFANVANRPSRQSPITNAIDFKYYDMVEQSDIAPTLAGLLGFPVPRNNLGVFMSAFLGLWEDEHERLQLLAQNAFQMMDIVKASFPHREFENVSGRIDCSHTRGTTDEIACAWMEANDRLKQMQTNSANSSYVEAERTLLRFCGLVQDIMANMSSNYNLSRMYLGIALATIAALLAYGSSHAFLSSSALARRGFGLIVVAYGAMMFASSYVEEEQNLWYWATCGWLTCLYLKESQLRPLSIPGILAALIFVISRITRRWNQTGQKHAGAPDIGNTFFRAHPTMLWVLVVATYIDIGLKLVRYRLRQISFPVASIMAITMVLVAFGFKLAFTAMDVPELVGDFGTNAWLSQAQGVSLVAQARAVFIDIAFSLAYNLVQHRHSAGTGISTKFESKASKSSKLLPTLHGILSIFLLTQSRITNIPLFFLFSVQQHLITRLCLTPAEITITALIFQHTSFFALGGSNAISSIDLSAGYNGVSSYHPVPVGFLTFVTNAAGPIWWTSATCLLLQQSGIKGCKASMENHVRVLTCWTACAALAVMFACTVLRSHLFVWSVFSPKFLVEMGWALGVHVVVNLVLGGLLASASD